MSEVKRYTAWAAEVTLPRGTMVVLAADYDALVIELAASREIAERNAKVVGGQLRRVAELEGLLRAADELLKQRGVGAADPLRKAIQAAKYAVLAAQPQQDEQCEFHGDDFAACQMYSGQIPCEPEPEAEPPAAVDERRDWSCYDTTFLLEHIRRDTNFDADLIGAMLKFSQSAQPFCHRMTVVMPERTVARFPNSWASGWNACLDKLICLNRNTVPLELLERIAKVPRGSRGLIDNADALDELRTILAGDSHDH